MYQRDPSLAEDPYTSIGSLWSWVKQDSSLFEMLWNWLQTRHKLDDWSNALELSLPYWLPSYRKPRLSLDMDVGDEKMSELERTVPSLISSHGYRVETHQVVTSDGYILELHRIPGPGKPVLLMHGMMCASYCWVTSGNNSLAFLLADLGFDVWLGNFRGTNHSRQHISLDPDEDLEFWRFTIHELGTMDLTAMICRILNISGKTKLSYVGHSMGTTSFLILSSLSKYKEIVAHVEHSILLAPVVAPHTMSNFISRLAPLHRWYRWFFENLGVLEILPGTFFLERLTWDHLAPPAMTLQLRGLATTQEDYRLLDRVCLYARNSKTSFYTILHYAQNICNKKFHAYDWCNEKKNKEKYGTQEAPTYNLGKVTVPISVFWSQRDSLSSSADVAKIVSEVRGLVEVREVELGHLDYLWGSSSARGELYQDIIRLLSDIHQS